MKFGITLNVMFNKAAKKVTNILNPKLIYLDAVKEAIKLCKKHNLNVLEIGCNKPVYANVVLGFKQELKKVLEELDEVTLHSPIGEISLSAFHPKILEASIEEFKLNIDLASYLNIKKIVMHPGKFDSIHAKLSLLSKKRVHDNFLNLNKYAIEKNVFLCMENLAKNDTLFTKPDEFKFFAKNNGYLTLDVGHAITNNIDPINFIDKFKHNVKHIHLQDNKINTYDQHLAIGDGDLDLESLLKKLKEIKYNETIIFELTELDRLEKSIRVVKELIID